MQFARVGKRSSLLPGHARAFVLGRHEIAIFNVEGVLYATENTCPHQGGPIAEGALEGSFVTCPWHAWCFDVRTGKMALGDFATLARFEVRVDGDDIYVATEPMAQ